MSEREVETILSGLLPGVEVAPIARQVSRLPDPDAATATLRKYPQGALPRDAWRLQALLTLSGFSPFLGDLLLRNPAFLDALPAGSPARGPRTREDLEEDLARFQSLDARHDVSITLRRFKQREYLRIALADFQGTADLGAITRSLSLLADVLVDKAVKVAWNTLHARFGMPTSRNERGQVEESRFAIIALGKLGGEELNYSSDIDLMYLFSRDGETSGAGGEHRGVTTNREFFTRLATEVTRLIAGHGPEGRVFRVDLTLRPGGRDGDIVMSAGSAAAYYRNWAEAWERQALIKARPAAGDLGLGRRFVEAIEPLVYSPSPDPYLALEIGAMKDRIDAKLSAEGRAETDIKLGRGGIREIEFAVQALQLKHGGVDPWLRQGNTLLALHRLADKAYLGYEEYASLTRAYTFLRDLEHRLQLGHDRQTATLPAADSDLRILARSMPGGTVDHEPLPVSLIEKLERHRSVVRAFYDSVVGQAAQRDMEEDGVDLWLDRLEDARLIARLRSSEFSLTESALGPVKAIRRSLQTAATDPETRRHVRRIGPALLLEVSRSANSRRALDNLERLVTSIAVSPVRLLRFLSRREVIGSTIRLLGRSDLLAGLIIRQPEILRGLQKRGRILKTPRPESYRRLLQDAVRGPGDTARRAARLRRRHQEALATIAIRDINRQATLREVLKSLSNLADACVGGATILARDDLATRGQTPPESLGLAVLALGRLGYRELDYGSDLDLVFLWETAGSEGLEGRRAAERWCEGIVRSLSSLSRDGQLYRIDLRLRPSGREGDLVTSSQGLRDYFARDAEIWEMQSFLKARPIAGDMSLGRRAVETIEALILERGRMGGRETLASSIDRMRRRLQEGAQDGPAGSPSVKLGEGGLLEVHFIIEFLQLLHALPNPSDKDTLRLLTLLHDRGHLNDRDLTTLYEGYLFLRSLQHELRLIHDPPLERLPEDSLRLEEIALALDPGTSDRERAGRGVVHAFRGHTENIRRIYQSVVLGRQP